MIAKLEKRYYAGNERVWVGEYKNLHNISHWHMEHELILCKTGTAHITLNEHEYSLTPGKGLLCYSGNIHSINAGQDCVLFVSLIDERTTTSLTCGRMPTQSLFHDDGHIQNQLMEIRRELYEKQPFFEQRTLALMILILVDIYRAQPLIGCQQENAQVNRYKQLLNRVDTDYSSITFDDAVESIIFSLLIWQFGLLSDYHSRKYPQTCSAKGFEGFLPVQNLVQTHLKMMLQSRFSLSVTVLRPGRPLVRIQSGAPSKAPQRLLRGLTLAC